MPQRKSNRLNYEEHTSVFEIEHNMSKDMDLEVFGEQINQLFNSMVREKVANVQAKDLVSVSILHPLLENEIFITSTYSRENLVNRFAAKMYEIAQSEKVNPETGKAGCFLDDGLLTMRLHVLRSERGGGRSLQRLAKKKAPTAIAAICEKKRSIFKVTNKTGFKDSCFWIALAHSKLCKDNKGLCKTDYKAWKKLKQQFIRNVRGFQIREAQKLATLCSMDLRQPVSRADLPKIQSHFDEQLLVISRADQGRWFYGTAPEDRPFTDVLALEYVNDFEHPEGHFNSIASVKGYFAGGSNHFCHHCWVQVAQLGKHTCSNTCEGCFNFFKCQGDLSIECEKCGCSFVNEDCKRRHQPNCGLQTVCPACECKRKKGAEHVCWSYECDKCHMTYSESPHYCSIHEKDKDKLQKEDKLMKITVAFDIESMFRKITVNGNQQKTVFVNHEPNLLCAKVLCDRCIANKENHCAICPEEMLRFRGKKCVKSFCDYLYNVLAPKAERSKATVTAFAHNFKGYDGRFVMRDLWQRNFEKPDIIMAGSKILKLQAGNVQFIDSLSFFQQPLSSLPKSFGFQDKEKGYFPFFANIEENQGKIIEMPKEEDFNSKRMKPEQYTKFKAWYDEQPKANYNFQAEMERYCDNDVEILMTAILKFRKQFKEITELDPTTRCFTLASIGMEVFRSTWLNNGDIGVTPIKGYFQRKHSKIGSAWSDREEIARNVRIPREVKIGPYTADGALLQQKLVFEYNGCHFHGHSCMFGPEEIVKPAGIAAKTLQERWEKKKLYYERHGFEVVVQTDCQCTPDVKERLAYYNELEAVGQASIAESFYGGRTNNLKFHHQAEHDEEIKYYDFTSLYPFVLKNFEYPVGHPIQIRQNFDYSLSSHFGFVKCQILPPNDLYLPVLPFRYHQKLEFVLCNQCALLKQKTECRHSEAERLLTGTWTTVELKKALEYGYKIIKIYDILHYEQTSNTLFSEYINLFLREKQEASGWPRTDMTEDEKDKYIEGYQASEDVLLRKESIEVNPGRRFIAKLMLNSFWGKLSQKCNLPNADLINNYDQFWKIHCDEKIEIISESMVTEDAVLVCWKFANEEDAREGSQNKAVSSFVTSHARLHLYDLLADLHRQRPGCILYFDTGITLTVSQ